MRKKLTFCGSRATNSADEKHTKPILNVVPSPAALGYDWILYSASTQLYISLVPFFHATDSNPLKNTVQECPRSSGKWRERASKLTCDAGKEYHCMMAEDFSFVEFCMGVRKIDSGKLNIYLSKFLSYHLTS